MKTRIKICCISSIEEARIAIRHGADALGLVGKMPSGPGPIADELIASIAKIIHPPIASFLLTSEQSSSAIIEHIRRTGVNTVQIVEALPHVRIVQVIHVIGEESIKQALAVHRQVDAILLDSGNPKAAVKTLGGTGNTHNWNISRELIKAVEVPVFLAGGLNPGNVRAAIATAQPFGVDICSGVRTNGKLDIQKLEAFISAVHS